MSRRLAKRQLVAPDYWTCPHGIRVRPEPALTYGPEVADLCDRAGYTPDPQQELGLDLTFAIRPDGSPASFAGCVICARQNLKSGLFLQCCIGWLFVLDDVPEIAWSAHELRTSLNAQDELYRILESPVLSKYLPPSTGRNDHPGLYDTNGKERIELNTGQTVWFQTRTRDGGRGLGKPKLILDEAFKLKARMVGALMPILLAQHHPQLLYGSSAPPYDPDAAQLRDVMDRGRNWKSPELWYLEWLAKKEPCRDPDCRHPKDALKLGIDCALDREHLILQANPTVDRDADGHALDTGRITIGTLRNLRQELPPEEYMRECLGWAEDPADAAKEPPIDVTTWSSLEERQAPPPVKAAVVLDVEPDLSAATVAYAGATTVPDERTGRSAPRVLVAYWRGPVGEAVGVVKKLRARLEVLEVALHPASQAKVLIPKLTAGNIKFHRLTHQELGAEGFQQAVKDRAVAHVGQRELDAAVSTAKVKASAGTQLWERSGPVPAGPLVAVSTAEQRWELLNAKPKTPPPAPEPIKDAAAALDDFNAQLVGF